MIYLQSEQLEGEVTQAPHQGWVDVDLVTWREENTSDGQVELQLLRRLNTRHPLLHELVRANLCEGKKIHRITLELPTQGRDSDRYLRYTLCDLKVVKYRLLPSNIRNRRPLEQLTLVARCRTLEEVSYPENG